MKQLLLTGASGAMGVALRPNLASLAETVVLSSRRTIGDLASHETWRPAELSDPRQAAEAVAGCDGIIHLGGISQEGPFRPILEANVIGVYNLYEAARQAGIGRILFASSNHVTGFYPQHTRLDAGVPHRPDSLYGVSKSFGESLARFYFDKFGIETAIVRIGSCFDRPRNHRMLSTWLSMRDFVQLVACVFAVPRLGCPVIYGASRNDRAWWDNSAAGYLGWTPQDNAEDFAGDVHATHPSPDADSSLHRYQGGEYVDHPVFTESPDA